MSNWRSVCTRAVLWLIVGGLAPSSARAADIYVAAGDSLQAAIDRAVPGDRILLAPGATFTGNFRLTNKGTSTEWITIRSAAPDTLLPPAGVRISPSDAANLAAIKSPNTTSALVAASGAHHWRLQYLEFRANDRGYGDIIALGAGDGTQTSIAQAPLNLVLEHLYIHGDPVIGQKRGISLHSGATWIRDCYISDIKAVGLDSQAVSGYNGPGPWTVENNYLEASGENVLIGGASPKIPDLVPADLVFRHNYLFKPLSWRLPILSTPAGVVATAGSGGALPAGTYSYRVLASRRTAQDSMTYSPRSTEVVATVAAGGRVSLTWAAVPNATAYRVYRGSAAGVQDRYFDATGPAFVDDGTLAGTAGSGDTMNGTVWLVKNLFELKLGERVTVDGNVMENCWQQAQTGFAILFTPRNQDNTSPWIYVRDVHLVNNLVRHAGSGIQIQGYDNNAVSQQTQRITIRNNVFDDIAPSRWGGSGRLFQIGDGPADIVIDHNVAVHEAQIIYVYGGTYGAETQVPGLVVTNNLFKHNTYGISGDRRASGNDTLNAYFPGAVVARNTLAGGIASKYPANNEFPTVADWQAQFVDFVASDFHLVSSSPYRGTGTDGLDLGPDLDVIDHNARMAVSGQTTAEPVAIPVAITTPALPDGLSGYSYSAALAATGGSGSFTWSVSSGSLPAGLVLDAATGVVAGTPSLPGTVAVTITVKDARDANNVASQAYTVRIASTPPQVSLTSPVTGTTTTETSLSLAASASDADGSIVSVSFYSGQALVATVTSAPWVATWTNVAPGTYTLSATATDNSGLSATSGAVVVTVAAITAAPPPVPVTRPEGEIVVYAADANRIVGQWQRAADSTAAGGYKLLTPDNGVGAPAQPAASPANYVEVAFSAPAGVDYHVWLRLKAQSDSPMNDSVWVQFSDSLTPAGAPVYRTGTTGALFINLEACSGCGVSGWGWQDTSFGATTSPVRFQFAGLHVVRIQQRQDGAQVDQIVLTPVATGSAPGALKNDTTVLPKTPLETNADVVICALDAAPADIHGTWSRTADATAAGGVALASADKKASALAAPLAAPVNYVDVTFPAVAGTPYRVWMRLRAARDQKSNDSAFVQFSDAAVNGTAAYEIGTTSGVLVNLEGCNGCGVSGWGWQGGAWWLTATPPVTFRYGGLHTVRIQAREDGVQFDQIVLSPDTWFATAPGAAKNDATILVR